MTLSQVPRELAERLIPNLHCSCACGEPKCMNCASDINELKAVIREAIEKTLEVAEQAVDDLRRTESYGLISIKANGDAKAVIRSLIASSLTAQETNGVR